MMQVVDWSVDAKFVLLGNGGNCGCGFWIFLQVVKQVVDWSVDPKCFLLGDGVNCGSGDKIFIQVIKQFVDWSMDTKCVLLRDWDNCGYGVRIFLQVSKQLCIPSTDNTVWCLTLSVGWFCADSVCFYPPFYLSVHGYRKGNMVLISMGICWLRIRSTCCIVDANFDKLNSTLLSLAVLAMFLLYSTLWYCSW